MKVIYRGHEINVNREKCLGGWSQLYFSIFRISDGYECLYSFEDSGETVRGKMQELKELIDAELSASDPWGEKESKE